MPTGLPPHSITETRSGEECAPSPAMSRKNAAKRGSVTVGDRIEPRFSHSRFRTTALSASSAAAGPGRWS